MFIVLFTPDQGREYGTPEAVGPFPSGDLALDYIDHCEVVPDWTAQVIEVSGIED